MGLSLSSLTCWNVCIYIYVAGSRGGGRPSEEEPHSLDDMGFTAADSALMFAEWKKTMVAMQHRVMQSNAFNWQLLNCVVYPNEPLGLLCGGASSDAPDRVTDNPQSNCAQWHRRYCGAHSPFNEMALMMGYSTQNGSRLTQHGSLPYFKQDLASFLLGAEHDNAFCGAVLF